MYIFTRWLNKECCENLSLFNKSTLLSRSKRETCLHWYCKTLTNSLTFWECKTQTSTVNKRFHSVLDRSEVSVEDSLSSPSRSLKLMSIRDLERWPRMRSRPSATSLPDQPSTTFQSGSSIDKRTQRLVTGPNLSQTTSMWPWEKISREGESQRTIEVSDTTGVSRLEVKEPSPLVELERLLVLPERSEPPTMHPIYVSISFHLFSLHPDTSFMLSNCGSQKQPKQYSSHALSALELHRRFPVWVDILVLINKLLNQKLYFFIFHFDFIKFIKHSSWLSSIINNHK